MKVLIDIPERMNELIHGDSQIDLMDMSHILYTIENGIVLDGLTNGEVLMKMFPQMKVTHTSNHVGLIDTDLDEFTDFRLEWWKRKWGE